MPPPPKRWGRYQTVLGSLQSCPTPFAGVLAESVPMPTQQPVPGSGVGGNSSGKTGGGTSVGRGWLQAGVEGSVWGGAGCELALTSYYFLSSLGPGASRDLIPAWGHPDLFILPTPALQTCGSW